MLNNIIDEQDVQEDEALLGSQEKDVQEADTLLPDAAEKAIEDEVIQNQAIEDEVSPADPIDATEESADPETFPREYVQELRQENARYRAQAKTADDLAQRLHVALVSATGRLADPTDLPFDPAHLEDPEALAAALEELVAGKPHLKSRRVTGDVGQGTRTSASADVDLLGILRGRAN